MRKYTSIHNNILVRIVGIVDSQPRYRRDFSIDRFISRSAFALLPFFTLQNTLEIRQCNLPDNDVRVGF